MNTGFKPKKCFEIKSADTAATVVDNKTTGEKYLYISSKQKSTPDNGALKAADNPALAPLLIKRRLCSLELLKNLLMRSPVQAPSCTEGPSRPKESPPRIERVPPINLFIMVLTGLFFIYPPIIAFI